MKRISQNPSIQSSYPLKRYVAQVNPQFWSNSQQDIVEYIGHILKQCGILNKLSHLTVRITRICKICKKVTSSDDERNILFEQLNGGSMAEIISGKVF